MVFSFSGGDVIQQECSAYVSRNGTIAEGEVFVGTPGSFRCKHVFHTVGPIWNGGHSNEENILYDAIISCMDEMRKRRLKSIALPAISCGIYEFPIDKAAEIILSAIRDNLKEPSSVEKVVLIDTNLSTVSEFLKVTDRELGVQPATPVPSPQSSGQLTSLSPGFELLIALADLYLSSLEALSQALMI